MNSLCLKILLEFSRILQISCVEPVQSLSKVVHVIMCSVCLVTSTDVCAPVSPVFSEFFLPNIISQAGTVAPSRALLRDADAEHKDSSELFFVDKQGNSIRRYHSRPFVYSEKIAILQKSVTMSFFLLVKAQTVAQGKKRAVGTQERANP